MTGNIHVSPLRFCNRGCLSATSAGLVCTLIFTVITLFPTYWPSMILDNNSWLCEAFTVQIADTGCETERGCQVPLVGHLLSQAIGSHQVLSNTCVTLCEWKVHTVAWKSYLNLWKLIGSVQSFFYCTIGVRLLVLILPCYKSRENSEMKWFAMVAWKSAAEVRHRSVPVPHRGPTSCGMCFLPWTSTKALFPFQPCFSVWLSQTLSICFFSLSGLVYPVRQREK